MEWKEKYFFDGSDGCDICQDATDYYDDDDDRPHENCDCDFRQCWIGTENECTDEEECFPTEEDSVTVEVSLSPFSVSRWVVGVNDEISSEDYESDMEDIFGTKCENDYSHENVEVFGECDIEFGGEPEDLSPTVNITISFEYQSCWEVGEEECNNEITVTDIEHDDINW